MPATPHAFEIGYSPTWELIDHSEVYFGALRGTEAFREKMLPRIKEKLPPNLLPLGEQEMGLLSQTEQWVKRAKICEQLTVGDDRFTLNWERPAERTGIYSILVNEKIASITLLLCRNDDLARDAAMTQRNLEIFSFMTALGHFLAEEELPDSRKLRLIDMTRRPLMTSMFWPPYAPTNDNSARTIQRQFAYAFFRMNGELA